jgi:hypothetical protein
MDQRFPVGGLVGSTHRAQIEIEQHRPVLLGLDVGIILGSDESRQRFDRLHHTRLTGGPFFLCGRFDQRRISAVRAAAQRENAVLIRGDLVLEVGLEPLIARSVTDIVVRIAEHGQIAVRVEYQRRTLQRLQTEGRGSRNRRPPVHSAVIVVHIVGDHRDPISFQVVHHLAIVDVKLHPETVNALTGGNIGHPTVLGRRQFVLIGGQRRVQPFIDTTHVIVVVIPFTREHGQGNQYRNQQIYNSFHIRSHLNCP